MTLAFKESDIIFFKTVAGYIIFIVPGTLRSEISYQGGSLLSSKVHILNILKTYVKDIEDSLKLNPVSADLGCLRGVIHE